jgi:hypothetical protein
MTRVITRTSTFKNDYKRMQKRGVVIDRLFALIQLLVEGKNWKIVIETIFCMEIMRETGNVMLSLIGF